MRVLTEDIRQELAQVGELAQLLVEIEARFPGFLDWYKERVKALGEEKR